MRLFLAALLLSLALPSAQAVETNKPVLTLSKKNTVVLRGEVSESSVANLEMQLLAMSQSLSPKATIYLVLDTPGGDVSAGLQLIDFVHALPQKVKTLTLFAASMGFQIAQNLDERLILPSGTLMSHRASISGLAGQMPGELFSRLTHIMSMVNRLDKSASARMGISLDGYKRMIHDELWLNGQQSVTNKAADRVVLARCDASFAGKSEVVLGSFMGITILGDMSNCPLISGVMNIHADGGDDSSDSRDYLTAWKSGKTEIVKQFMTTGKHLWK